MSLQTAVICLLRTIYLLALNVTRVDKTANDLQFDPRIRLQDNVNVVGGPGSFHFTTLLRPGADTAKPMIRRN